MLSLIPKTRVYLDFNPQKATLTATSYKGAVVAIAKKLHDLQENSKHFFTPAESDTKYGELEGVYKKTFVYTITDLQDATTYGMTITDMFGVEQSYTYQVITAASESVDKIYKQLAELINADTYCSVVAEYNENAPESLFLYQKNNNIVPTINVITAGREEVNSVALPEEKLILSRLFPNISSVNPVDPFTVKLYSKDTYKFSGKFGGEYKLFPLSYNKALICKEDLNAIMMAEDTINNSPTGDSYQKVWSMSSSMNFIAPGSVVIELKDESTSTVIGYLVDWNTGIETFDFNSSGSAKKYFSKTLDGKLYIYPVANANFNITNNTSKVNYENNIIDINIEYTSSVDISIRPKIKSTLIPINTFDDVLAVGDVIAFGYSVPNNALVQEVMNRIDDTTYTLTTSTNPEIETVVLRFEYNGYVYYETEVYDSGTNTSVFTNNSGLILNSSIDYTVSPATINVNFVSGTKVRGVAVFYRDASFTYTPDSDTFGYTNSPFKFTEFQTKTGINYVIDNNFFNFRKDTYTRTYAKIKNIESMTMNGIHYPVYNFTMPLFMDRTGNSFNFNYHTPQDLTFITYRTDAELIIDHSTITTVSGDPIYIESGNTDELQNGNLHFKIDTSTGELVFSNEYITGILYIEFEELLYDIAETVNIVKPEDEEIYEKVGQPDPRNPLGFAIRLIKEISPMVDFYIVPAKPNNLAAAIAKLEAYREILHVAVIDEEGVNVGYSWVQNENSPEVSRFRIIYAASKLDRTVYKVATENSFSTFDGNLLVPNDGVNHAQLIINDPSVDLTIYNIEKGDIFIDEFGNKFTVYEAYSNAIIFYETDNGAGSPVNIASDHFRIYRILTDFEIADYYYNGQGHEVGYLVKVLMDQQVYTYEDEAGNEYSTMIDFIYGAVEPFALKIALPPHAPLTYVSYDGTGLGKTTILSDMSETDLNKLVNAGYYIIVKFVDTPYPFCIKDVTTAIKKGYISAEAFLSKITPVYHYAKDIYMITKQFLGKYNVTEELASIISLKLLSLREIYLGREYSGYGTLLKTVNEPKIEIIPNGFKIYYSISTQDPVDNIENYITVES